MRPVLALSFVVALVALGVASAADDKRVDHYGDPLPSGATARLGTLRLRHHGDTTAIAFPPDEKMIASAGADRTVRLWDLATGKEVTKIDLGAAATTLSFSLDGTVLLSYADGQVRLTDLTTKKETRKFGVANGRGAFTPAGDLVASCDQQGTVNVSEVMTGKIVLEVHIEAAVDAVAISRDGKQLAFGARDNAIRVWDLEKRTETRLLGHEGWVNSVAFSPDGTTLYSASADKTVRVWRGGALVKKLEGHRDFVDLVAGSSDGKLLASFSHDGMLKVWETATWKERFSQRALATALEFSRDGRSIGVGGGQAVMVLAAETGKEKTIASGHAALVTCVAFSSDSQTVASGSIDETIRLWEVGAAREFKKIDAHEGGVTALAYAPGGHLLASGGRDGLVKVWDASSQSLIQTFEGHTDSIVSVLFSPDGKLVASVADQSLRIWDLGEKKMVKQIGIGGDPGPLAWSPDGKRFACGAGDHVIRTFDAMTYKEGPKLDGQKQLTALAYPPDGKTLVALGEEPSIKIWDVDAVREARQFPSEDPYLACCAFSSDGRKIAVGRTDGPVRILDFATGKELKTLDAGKSGAYSIAFSPDGRSVVWGSSDGTVLVGDAR
jgi:WD40 repeat protein